VFLNLLHNSLLATENLRERWVSIQSRVQGGRIRITITDSGKGIPADERDKIFQPFFTTRPVGKATGLGLAVAQGIIESHGGSLTLDASYPHTRFVIELGLMTRQHLTPRQAG
jgi:signal transduction histidine kinase